MDVVVVGAESPSQSLGGPGRVLSISDLLFCSCLIRRCGFGQSFAGKHPTCCVTGDRSVMLRYKPRDGSSCHFGNMEFCGRCDVMDKMSQFGLDWVVQSVCGVTSTYAY